MFKKIAIFTLLAILGTASITTATLAYKGDKLERKAKTNEQKHLAMQKAFEKADYQKWKDLGGPKNQVKEKINEQNFAKFAQAWKLAKQGNTEEANKIRAEIGLPEIGTCGESGEGCKCLKNKGLENACQRGKGLKKGLCNYNKQL